MLDATKKINFGAGPSKIPTEVMIRASSDFCNYNGTGLALFEHSHRSNEFGNFLQETINLVKELMLVPDNYEILFMHGGGTGQFAAIPLNLIGDDKEATADYLISGTWSKKAAEEASKYVKVNKVIPDTKNYTTIPPREEWVLTPNAKYFYYCANETVHGIEIKDINLPKETVIVADVSSNILSRPFDVSKHGIVFAGTQKNLGVSGVTLVIIRKDLLNKPSKYCPSILNFTETAKHKSLYNTPSMFSIHMTYYTLCWIKKIGGTKYIFENNRKKAKLLYDTIDKSNNFYFSPIDKKYRSSMNVPFRIGGKEGNVDLEKLFIEESLKKGMIGLKGHRSVGGIRASIYNSITIDEVNELIEFMKEFQISHTINDHI
ncbi:Phosphoserine aminotransferase [Strongyloides ratti]|uniref:Phosphoserine aminotransferase n=1 Tax=Strongyloides ratti TaxID=34506 RepID=A0A090LM82_STRRB|nr:Phosphoserine aminotransferase [Strongyloides ratti]CEF68655.1 Phosphoserine aminotransferase [Strongyloides ratti]